MDYHKTHECSSVLKKVEANRVEGNNAFASMDKLVGEMDAKMKTVAGSMDAIRKCEKEALATVDSYCDQLIRHVNKVREDLHAEIQKISGDSLAVVKETLQVHRNLWQSVLLFLES